MIENVSIQTTHTDVLVSPANKQYATTSIFLCNTSTSTDVLFDVYLVKGGQVASNSNVFLKNITLPMGDTFVISDEKIVLSNGDKLVVQASINNLITATVSYIEY